MPRDFCAAPRTGGSILPLTLDRVTYEAGGKRLIDSISLHLKAGPLTIVMGPNGAGKSLLLRLCHGLIRPTTGSVTWAEKAIERVRRSQAMVFQHPVLLRRSAAANIDYVLGACGIPKGQRKALVLDVLAQAGLSHLARQPARVLSGGEQQRLALARALALKPQILFLDEPTSNLDPAATRAVEDMIHTIRTNRTKIVMTTHDLGQARRLADEIVFLHQGRLLEQAPAREFFMAPRCEEANAFLEGRLLW